MKPARIERRSLADAELEVTLHLLPEKWSKDSKLLGERFERYRESECRDPIWVLSPLRRMLPVGEPAPLPDAALARLIWMEQEFRENLIVVMGTFTDRSHEEELQAEADWLEEFLEDSYGRLNGLTVVSPAFEEGMTVPLHEMVPYYEFLYDQTGLPVLGCGGLPAFSRKGAAVVDLRKGYRPSWRNLPEGSLYLDLTSDQEKERLIAVKRRDICYAAAFNFLDTHIRNMYNT